MTKAKKEHTFREELKRDWNTLKTLSFKKKIGFIWDYYKWPIIIICFSIYVFCLIVHMVWEGQKPQRLHICVVLNTEDDCSPWFDDFTENLISDGKPGNVDINYDQPFDYNDRNYYVYEIEVMTAISSQRMDAAICNEDMYHYLLALNACMPLDENLPNDLVSFLSDNDKLVLDTANLQPDENGEIHQEDGIEGYYAIDLSGTAFSATYNQPEEGGTQEPLYAVVISNTDHLRDCEALLRTLLLP